MHNFELMEWFLDAKHLFDAISFVLGLLYLFFEFRASIWLWPVGIVMPIVHSITYYKTGLYADFGMEFFYVLVAVYGFWKWKYRSGKAAKQVPISRIPANKALCGGVAFMALWAGIAAFLHYCTDSTVPLLDAFTTSLSIVAYWALAQKWVEQWLLWLVVDVICTGLYVYKGIPFSAALYGFYSVMAVLGYRNWLRLMKQQSPPA